MGGLGECARPFELEAACDKVAYGICLLDLLKESRSRERVGVGTVADGYTEFCAHLQQVGQRTAYLVGDGWRGPHDDVGCSETPLVASWGVFPPVLLCAAGLLDEFCHSSNL